MFSTNWEHIPGKKKVRLNKISINKTDVKFWYLDKKNKLQAYWIENNSLGNSNVDWNLATNASQTETTPNYCEKE